MDVQKNNLAFVFMGGFSRLGPNFGVLNACHQATRMGFQPPDYAVGSSAGNIDLLIGSQWDEESLKIAREVMLNLERKHFASLHPQLKRKLALELAATTALLLPTHLIPNKTLRYGTALLLAGLAYYSEERMLEALFKSPSLLVYDNLVKLLSRMVNFDKVFDSPLKIEVPSVNLNKAGWTLDTLYDPTMHLKGWSVMNNFEPQFVNLEPAVRKQRMINAVVNGARVFGFFNPGQDENGDYITDTAALSNIPIQFAVRRGYTNIVVFMYNCTGEGITSDSLDMLVKALPRNFDVVTSENTRKTTLGYLRVNNDLDELEKQERSMRELEKVLDYPQVDEVVKASVRRYLREKRESDRRLSYAGKQRINLLLVRSDYLPVTNFSSFTKDDIETGMLIGEKAFWDNVRTIEKMRTSIVKAL